MHKTGSTALQTYLSSEKFDDWHYVSLGNPNHSIAMYTLFSEDYMSYPLWKKAGFDEKKIIELRNSFKQNMHEQLSNESTKNFILSAESVGLLKDIEKEALLKYLISHDLIISVICYVREPKSYAYSTFQENVKAGITDLKNEYDPRYYHRLNYFNSNNDVSCLKVKNFHHLKNNSIIDDFLSTFSMKSERTTNSLENSRLTISSLKILHHLNKIFKCTGNYEKFFQVRIEFISFLEDCFAHDKRKYEELFNLHYITKEINYLSTTYDICFNSKVCDYRSNSSALSFLNDLSDLCKEGLNKLCLEYGVSMQPSDLEKTLDKIAYKLV